MIQSQRRTIFACVGDVHGEMGAMVEMVLQAERGLGEPVEFVLQVGDFEPHRHELDLETMAAPHKYRRLGEFRHILAGRLRLPWPLFFIGGNHEPYGYLDSHPQGFELCTNCTYLGRSFAGDLRGVRVCALSGIYHPEKFSDALPPLEDIDRVSNKEYTYFREPHVDRLLEEEAADVLLLHEWPTGVIAEEDAADFEQQRRSLRYDAVGNSFAELLVEHLRPSLVVAGHLHRSYRSRVRMGGHEVRFAALAKVGNAPGAVAVFAIDGTMVRELGVLSDERWQR